MTNLFPRYHNPAHDEQAHIEAARKSLTSNTSTALEASLDSVIRRIANHRLQQFVKRHRSHYRLRLVRLVTLRIFATGHSTAKNDITSWDVADQIGAIPLYEVFSAVVRNSNDSDGKMFRDYQRLFEALCSEANDIYQLVMLRGLIKQRLARSKHPSNVER
jgi:hypothetical protein